MLHFTSSKVENQFLLIENIIEHTHDTLIKFGVRTL
jgi:hypothetical protein